MSKVVHLSDDAHARAKDFCKENKLRMSDWVASLIDEAISRRKVDTVAREVVPRKKPLMRAPEPQAAPEEGVPAYAAPPFWASRSAQ